MRLAICLLGLAAAALLPGCQSRLSAPPAASPASDAPRAAPDAPLRETCWVARQLAGQPVRVAADTFEPYVVLRADGTAEGHGGCNRFRGSFQTAAMPGALTFGALLSTRMACPALPTETAFTGALQQTQTYRISGDTLRLFGAGAAPLARLEAVYLR